ncbi:MULTISPECIES: hypothetical protein [Arsenicicoccus]|uniref:Uncharacterized protein n=1 Tax=Arsenicicoccus bolidensis TaxID=229480 RepID=A0ABS9Q4S4_9MICO|nr:MULTISPECIES: hypothetical protein [Arsenicicoccus]MCG7322881.1 hypothetical protein [Arsenicicoccus bolidensis]
MSPYAAPAGDPASCSALAAALRRHHGRVADALAVAREPGGSSTTDEERGLLEAMDRLASGLQAHATHLSDLQSHPPAGDDERVLATARHRAEVVRMRRVLAAVDARLHDLPA